MTPSHQIKRLREEKNNLTDPKDLWLLLQLQLGKEAWTILLSLAGPSLVLAQQTFRELAGLLRDWREVRGLNTSIIIAIKI
jgi:hypothetical protein